MDLTFNEMGCPAPAGLSGSLPSGPEAAKAKLLRMGVSSLLKVTASGLCSPMLPSLPSSGILLEKPLSADACIQSISLHVMLARESCMSVSASFREI